MGCGFGPAEKSYEKHTCKSCLDYPSFALFCDDFTDLCALQRIRPNRAAMRIPKPMTWPVCHGPTSWIYFQREFIRPLKDIFTPIWLGPW